MSPAFVIIVAAVLLIAIAFLGFGMSRSQRGAPTTERVAGVDPGWKGRTRLARMRKAGGDAPPDESEDAVSDN